MGIVIRQAAKTSIVIFTGAILGALIIYGYSIVFPKTEVGVSRNLLNQGVVISQFLLLGSVSVLHTYAQRFSNNNPKRPVLITFSLLIPFVSTAIFCIPYFLFKNYIVSRYQSFDRPYIIEFYNWLPLLGLFISQMTILEFYLISRMKVALSSSIREIFLRLCNLLLIALFFAKIIDFHYFMIFNVLIYFLPVAILFFISLKTEGFSISFNWKIFSKNEIKSMIHYAWYHMMMAITLNLTSMLDVMLLGMLSTFGMNDVAVYSNAIFLTSILAIPFRAMTGAAFPRINELFVNQDKAYKNLFLRSAINMQIASVAMWIIIICNLHNAVAILPKGYEAIAPCVFILSLGRLMDMSTGLNTEMISITSHYKFTFRISVLLVIAILILDRIFIPKLGLYGAAWVSTATLAAFNVAKVIFLYRKLGILPFNNQSWKIFGIGAGIFLLNHLLPTISNPIIDATYRSLAIILLYLAALRIFKPSEDLTHFL